MATWTLSKDHSFHFELLRVLGAARFGGADVAEVLAAAGQIAPGDFESWYRAFVTLADTVYLGAAPTPVPAPGFTALMVPAIVFALVRRTKQRSSPDVVASGVLSGR